jgi:hypothetical protein
MLTGRTIVLWAFAFVFAGGFVGWRLYGIRHAAPPAYVALVHDDSGSEVAGCPAVRSIAVGALKLPNVANGSQFALIATGDKDNGYDGKLLHVFDIPVSRRVMEGREAEKRRQNEFGDAVKKACEGEPRKAVSPIFGAVKNALDHVRANRCGPSGACYVYVVTDGEENVDPLMRSALAGSKAALKKLTGTIPNEGIHVSFCGFAQTRVPGHGSSLTRNSPVERLQAVWTAVFSAPALVSIAPYCRD